MIQAACTGQLDAEGQRRVETSTKLVHYVLNKWFHRWLHTYEDELVSVGRVALCIAALHYDPQRASWGTFATRSIWCRVLRRLERLQVERDLRPLSIDYRDDSRDDADWGLMNFLADPDTSRPVPPPPAWECAECGRPIDWDENRNRPGGTRASKVRGLCASCDRRRERYRNVGMGQGICARCGRVMRKKTHAVIGRGKGKRTLTRPSCDCFPLWPSYTLDDAAAVDEHAGAFDFGMRGRTAATTEA